MAGGAARARGDQQRVVVAVDGHVDYLEDVAKQLKARGIRVEVDASDAAFAGQYSYLFSFIEGGQEKLCYQSEAEECQGVTPAETISGVTADDEAIVSALSDPMMSPSLDHLPFMLGGADVSFTIEQQIPLSGIRRSRRGAAGRPGRARGRPRPLRRARHARPDRCDAAVGGHRRAPARRAAGGHAGAAGGQRGAGRGVRVAVLAAGRVTFGTKVAVGGSPGLGLRVGRRLGTGAQPLGTVVRAGGGETAATVARALEGWRVEVKILERNRARAEQLARRFPHWQVLQGDATDLAPVVGGNLRRLRTRRGLSLEKLAQSSGVSRAMLGQIQGPPVTLDWASTFEEALKGLTSGADELLRPFEDAATAASDTIFGASAADGAVSRG